MANGFPEDVKPQWSGPLLLWLNVIRRLQSVGRQKNEGYAVLTIRVLVDGDGKPVTWSEPECTKLEPMANGAIPDVLALLCKNR
jgi:hypothetical protein